MDRKKQAGTQGGIEVRDGKSGTTIRIHFTFKGVRCRESLKLSPTKANLTYADRLRGEILNAIERGTFKYQDYFPDSKRAQVFGHVVCTATMADRLDLTLKGYEKATENGSMSPSTLEGYRKIVEGRLKPEFGLERLRDITPSRLRVWVSGLGVTAKTARNILGPLRSAFDDAVNDGAIEFNPLDRVALKKLLSQTAEASTYEVDPFTGDEIDAILEAAPSAAEQNMYQFWFNTGLRPGELIALEWSKVDFVHRTVRIDSNIVVRTEKAPKTAAGIRDVELNQKAIDALRHQKDLTFLAGGRVFISPKTMKPWETEQQIRRTSWQYILKRAGVRYRNPYQTRHTYASHHVSAGKNLFWLARQMGHETTEMIIRHYGRWIPSSSWNGQAAPVTEIKAS